MHSSPASPPPFATQHLQAGITLRVESTLRFGVDYLMACHDPNQGTLVVQVGENNWQHLCFAEGRVGNEFGAGAEICCGDGSDGVLVGGVVGGLAVPGKEVCLGPLCNFSQTCTVWLESWPKQLVRAALSLCAKARLACWLHH
jgi:hypothetical protein